MNRMPLPGGGEKRGPRPQMPSPPKPPRDGDDPPDLPEADIVQHMKEVRDDIDRRLKHIEDMRSKQILDPEFK